MANTDKSLFEDPTLLLEFIAESLEHLESIESRILDYEKATDDKDLINSIFRAIHSIKGAASFFNLTEISELSHKLETLLNDLRNDRRSPNPEIMDILLSGSDLLRTLIKRLSETTDGQIEDEMLNVQEMVGRLERLLSNEQSKEPSSDQSRERESTTANTETGLPAEAVMERESKTNNAEIPSPSINTVETVSAAGYEITTQMLESFKIEAAENLQTVEDAIMSLDKNREDKSQINSMFRGIHTIKGASDYLGLNNIKTLTHELESLLDVMRKIDGFKPEDSTMDLLFESIDAIKFLCATPHGPSSKDLTGLIGKIRKELSITASQNSNNCKAAENPIAPPDSRTREEKPVTENAVSTSSEQAKDASQEATGPKLDIFMSSAKQCLDSIKACQGRAALGGGDEKVLQTYLRSVGTLKNSASYMSISGMPPILCQMEDILNIVKTLGFTKEFVELLGENILCIEKEFDSISKSMTPSINAIHAKISGIKEQTPANESNEAGERDTSTLSTIEESQKKEESKPAASSPNCGTDEKDIVQKDSLNSDGKLPEPELKPSANTPDQKSAGKAPSTSGEAPKVQSVKTMRIEEERLDTFMSLVGELIISKNTFSHIARRLENNEFDDSTLEEFQAAMFSVNRITDELQNNVMSMRMIPVKTVFQRFPRLVRDLSKKKNKQVELQILGEETELDKGIAEEIGDPLVHLIRNALDHGLETPEERKAKGKDESGHVILKASHEGNNMIIEVIDDGKGIDTEKVLKKALEKGIVRPEDAENMTRDRIMNLIFLPGFSTADQVTEVSGRGVGMDVVHNNIAKLNGVVKLESEKGKGTRIRIELPLTLAIIEALLVYAAGHDFAIPLDSVLETIQVLPKDITIMQKKEVVLLRGEPIGIVRLKNIMNLTDGKSKEDRKKIPVVIIAAGSRKVGIVVDKLMDQEEVVIKPLHESLAEIPGLGGASIMGDGRIILVLDPLELINMTEKHAGTVKVK